MRDPNRKLVYLLWVVIAVLVIGAGIGGYLMVNKLNDLQDQNAELTSNADSLREQLRQVKAAPTPSQTPLAAPTPSATPTPTATPTPAHTVTPKAPTPKP